MNSTLGKALRPFLYNPLRQEPEELERLFVARRTLFDRMFAEIIAQRADAVPQHQLVIGQRGMGKTTMLARLGLELRKTPHADKFLALSFWEEQYIEMDRLSVFWLNCLDSLADEIAKAHGEAKARELDEIVRGVRNKTPEEDRARAARDAFSEAMEHFGRRPVLLIDNFNLMLGRLKKHDHILRGFFTRHGAPIIIGAAVTPPEDIADYDAAFYDGFKTTLLHRLNIEEVKEIIEHLAKEQDQPQAIQNLWNELPRLSALRDLSGGNPRTTLLIYRLCANGFSADVYRDLETLLDETTPVFQSRFERLSEQGQKLVVRLARHWRPATAEMITEQTDFPRGTVSPLLGRLESDGIIEKVPLYDPERRDLPKDRRGGLSKKIGYQLAERFFNIWLLMRSGSRRERAGIACLARFIETLYSKEERIEYASRLTSMNNLDWGQAIMACALADTLDDFGASRRHDLRTRAESVLVSIAKGVKEKLAEIIDPSDIQPKVFEIHDLRQRIKSLVPKEAVTFPDEFADLVLGSVSMLLPGGLNRWSLAESNYLAAKKVDSLAERLRDEYKRQLDYVGADTMNWLRQRLLNSQLTSAEKNDEVEAAIENAPNAIALSFLGGILRDTLPSLSEKACRMAIERDENQWEAWQMLGFFAEKSRNFDQTENCYRRAYDLYQKWAPSLCDYAHLLGSQFGRWKDAEHLLRQAKELEPRDYNIALQLGLSIELQGKRASEAISEYRRAAALNPSSDLPWIRIGAVTQSQLKDYAAAETYYRNAISMTSKGGYARTQLALLLQSHRGQPDEAERLYRRAIEDGEADGSTWIGLGNLLSEHRKRFDEAAEAFKTAIDKYDDAVGWVALGVMQTGHLNRDAEAEASFRRALAADPKLSLAWFQLAILLTRNANTHDEAARAFERAVELAPSTAMYWNGLGNAKLDFLGDLDAAEAAFRKALDLDPGGDGPRVNLVFLLRDYRGKTDAARLALSELRQPDKWKDSLALHIALFAAYDDNWGQATDALRLALAETANRGLPKHTQDDWFRASAVLLHLGFGEKLLDFLSCEGWDVLLLPWFSALEAHDVGDRQMLLNIPAEAREAAGIVFDQIARRRSSLPKRNK